MRQNNLSRPAAEKPRDQGHRVGRMPAWCGRLEDHFDVSPDIASGIIAEYFHEMTSELLGQSEPEDLFLAARRTRQTRLAQLAARAL